MGSRPSERFGAEPRESDAGAVLLEAALALMVVVTLVVGVSQVSGSWGSETSTDRLAARAVRMAASVGQPQVSDLDLLALVGAGLGEATLQRILIYRPAGPDGAPSASCAALRPAGTAPAGVAGWCVVYGPEHLAAWASGGAPLVSCAAGAWDESWCPARRRPDDGATGWVGVLVEVRPRLGGSWDAAGASEVSSAQAVAALDPVPRSRP